MLIKFCFFCIIAFGSLLFGEIPSVSAVRFKTTLYSGPSRTIIRVLALTNGAVDTATIGKAGWRIISRVNTILSLEGRSSAVKRLAAIPGISYIKMPSPVFVCMDSVRKQTRVNQVQGTVPGGLPTAYTGKGVLVGIMDTEFDTHHPAFLTSNGATRFVAVWDQEDTVSKIPNRYGFGAIKRGADLEAAPLFGADGTPEHGTAMASFAVGSDRKTIYSGVAPDAAIIGVKYSQNDNDFVNGLQWMFSIADSLKMPCVVNVSIGNADGPHDGTSLMDRCIDSLSGPGRIVVGAVGNDGDKMSHISFTLNQGESKATWVAPYKDTTAHYQSRSGLDMWGEQGKVITATFFIFDQIDSSSNQIPGTISTANTLTNKPILCVSPNPRGGGNDTCLLESRTETTSLLNGKAHLTAYLYSNNPSLLLGVSVSVAGQTGGVVHAWNLAKKAFKSYGISGFFDGDSLSTVNEIGGTAKRNITVGAYVGKASHILWNGTFVPGADDMMGMFAPFSGHGPTVDGRVKPDICAPGTQVVGALNRFVNNPEELTVWPDTTTTIGRYAGETGTSVSAPIVAGIVALMLEANPSLTPEQVREHLQKTAITDQHTGSITMPNNSWGAGKVNALGAIARMLGVVAAHKGALPDPSTPLRIIPVGVNRCKVTGTAAVPACRLVAEIYSLLGKRLLSVEPAGNGIITFPTKLKSGTYLLRIRAQGTTLTEAKFTLLSR
jgi:minor extracellular serine protease Vpr